MSKLIWDQTGDRSFETGVDRGVLFPQVAGVYGDGVAWNGLTTVSESPSGAELSDFWADNIKYASLRSAEEFGATIEAYTYPEEFEVCDGSAELADGVLIGQQNRSPFGFCYRTKVGDDTGAEGYKIHIIYGASASPTEKAYATVNDSPEAITFSWEINTNPVAVTGNKPTATVVIDSTKADATKLAALEAILYGVDASTEPVVAAVPARLPLPDEIATLMAA